jgi:FtsH-binding integral membrane protein
MKNIILNALSVLLSTAFGCVIIFSSYRILTNPDESRLRPFIIWSWSILGILVVSIGLIKIISSNESVRTWVGGVLVLAIIGFIGWGFIGILREAMTAPPWIGAMLCIFLIFGEKK